MPSLSPDWILTAAIVLTTVALSLVGRQLRRHDSVGGSMLLAVFFLLAVWIPELWRDGLIVVTLAGVGAFLAGSALAKVVAFFVAGAITAGLAWLVPGGTMPLLLTVLALAGAVEVRDARRHLGRMGRAIRLLPGQRPEGEVEVGGVVGTEQVAPPPTLEFEAAAWQIQAVGVDQPRKARPPLLSLNGPDGTVQVDLERVELRVDGERSQTIHGEAGAAALRAMGIEAEVESKALDDGTAIHRPLVEVRWLPPGHEVYVVGTPVWESVRGGGYRDSKLVPVFRDEADGFVVDRSEGEERRRAHWTLWQWAGWGAVCVGIAVVQVVFGVL